MQESMVTEAGGGCQILESLTVVLDKQVSQAKIFIANICNNNIPQKKQDVVPIDEEADDVTLTYSPGCSRNNYTRYACS
jgi:hypothetical protein